MPFRMVHLIYADKAYNDYAIEDLLKEVEHIAASNAKEKSAKSLTTRDLFYATLLS